MGREQEREREREIRWRRHEKSLTGERDVDDGFLWIGEWSKGEKTEMYICILDENCGQSMRKHFGSTQTNSTFFYTALVIWNFQYWRRRRTSPKYNQMVELDAVEERANERTYVRTTARIKTFKRNVAIFSLIEKHYLWLVMCVGLYHYRHQCVAPFTKYYRQCAVTLDCQPL